MDSKSLDACRLGEALSSLNNSSGVIGCLVTDEEGCGLFSQLPSGIDKSVCESAVATLNGSSAQVINWANQGDLVSVMLEADAGKILLSNAANLNIVVIAQKEVNLGLLRVSLKKARSDIESLVLGKPLEERLPVPSPKPVVSRPVSVSESPSVVSEPKVDKKLEVKPKMQEIPLPVLPEIPAGVDIPNDPAARADLAFDIYKALFLSLSIGASRVSGVAPARGMLRRYLPMQECGNVLSGVNVKDDATLDFEALRENINKLPPAEREAVVKEKFGHILSSLINGYGSVMGYTPLKGMTRKEMGIVLKGYGEAMKKLGIVATIPEEFI